MERVPLTTVLREWGRIGVLGFGGPPAHIALLRDLCVERRRWLDAKEFEDANAACGLLPGPASTQLAIYCARRAGGPAGALVGGLAFIVPGLALLIAIAALALAESPADWVLGLGAGAGAAVVAVVVEASIKLARPSLGPLRGARRVRAVVYLVAGVAAAALIGTLVVLVLLACGLIELSLRARPSLRAIAWPLAVPLAATGSAALPALVWTAFKVGALSYGGGFVIIPLMQGDAVDANHWMSRAEFLNAVAYGQLTPGPVVQTVAAVGYAAAGLGGALLAAAVAFGPSFAIVLLAGERFERQRTSMRARAFLDGAGPAAIGAIAGAAVPLARAIAEPWQGVALAAATVALLARQSPLRALLLGAALGVTAAAAGLAVPR